MKIDVPNQESEGTDLITGGGEGKKERKEREKKTDVLTLGGWKREHK